jgi:uncharacterized protein (DUF1015 family)
VQTLPSNQQPAAGAHGLTLAPFRGVRYAADRVSGIANVTSPPYDVIGPGTVQRLLESEPHNVVRLILPGAGSPQSPDGPHTSEMAASQLAARDLYGWLASGVLVRDPEPTLYAYEQSMPASGGDTPGTGGPGATRWAAVQRGLIGALRLVPAGSPSVLPHEDVMPGPVEGRRELMETAQANLEPIFLLYDSGEDGGQATGGPESPRSQATRLVDAAATTREPILAAVTDDGIRHRVWALTDPAEHAAIAADLGGRSALIADGHHRYAAYLKMQDQERGDGQSRGPWDFGLAFLVDSAAYPPRIGAIHRVVPGLAPARAAEMAKGALRIRHVENDLDDAVQLLADAGREGPAFLLTDGADQYLLTDPQPDRLAEVMPPDHSARWRSLAAAVLRELLIQGAWQLRDAEPEVVVVPGDAAAAVQAAREAHGTAVICNPVSAADVRAVAENGERMPRKSTSFGPKPRTGLVMRTFVTP